MCIKVLPSQTGIGVGIGPMATGEPITSSSSLARLACRYYCTFKNVSDPEPHELIWIEILEDRSKEKRKIPMLWIRIRMDPKLLPESGSRFIVPDPIQQND